MTNGEIGFAAIVGVISAIGVVMAAYLTMYATKKAAELAAKGLENQIRLNSAVKLAEFRQGWINELRQAIAKFQSLGDTLKESDLPQVHELQAKIELLMNRKDKRYESLVDAMAAFITETDDIQRALRQTEFMVISQDILKAEWETLKREIGHIPPSKSQ